MMLLLLTLWGCSSTHNVGRLIEYDSAKERSQNVQRLQTVAAQESLFDTSSTRVLAIKNIGLLQPTDTDTINTLLNLSGHAHPDIRRMSIWSLGEIGRVLDWDDESQKIASTLQNKLLKAPSNVDAQYILESMIKLYCQHAHTLNEDVALVKLLQQYHSKSSTPPNILYFFEQEIQSLPVLLQILSEKVDGSAEETYTANMEVFRYLQKNTSILSRPQYKSLVIETLNAEISQLSSNEIVLQMLALWILGSSAQDGIVQEYVALELISQVETASYRHLILLHSALWNMLEVEAVRVYFRELLRTSEDPIILQTVGAMGYRLDAVQQLYTVHSGVKP